MADTVQRLFTEPLDGGCCFALFIELLARFGFRVVSAGSIVRS